MHIPSSPISLRKAHSVERLVEIVKGTASTWSWWRGSVTVQIGIKLLISFQLISKGNAYNFLPNRFPSCGGGFFVQEPNANEPDLSCTESAISSKIDHIKQSCNTLMHTNKFCVGNPICRCFNIHYSECCNNNRFLLAKRQVYADTWHRQVFPPVRSC